MDNEEDCKENGEKNGEKNGAREHCGCVMMMEHIVILDWHDDSSRAKGILYIMQQASEWKFKVIM